MLQHQTFYNNPIVQLTVELLLYIVVSYYRICDTSSLQTQGDLKRQTFVIIHTIDTFLLITKWKTNHRFKMSLIRNMLHASIHEIKSHNNPYIIGMRLLHHLITIYMVIKFPQTTPVRLFICLFEAINLLSAGLHLNNSLKLNVQTRFKIHSKLITLRLYAQLICRTMVIIFSMIYYYLDPQINRRFLIIGSIIILIGFIEITHCYQGYIGLKDLRSQIINDI